MLLFIIIYRAYFCLDFCLIVNSQREFNSRRPFLVSPRTFCKSSPWLTSVILTIVAGCRLQFLEAVNVTINCRNLHRGKASCSSVLSCLRSGKCVVNQNHSWKYFSPVCMRICRASTIDLISQWYIYIF